MRGNSTPLVRNQGILRPHGRTRLSRSTTIAVTGATGFVGQNFSRLAAANGYRLRSLLRPGQEAPIYVDEAVSVDLSASSPIDPAALEGCAAVVHLAARVPQAQTDVAEAAKCWTVNALGSLRLVEAAIRAQVGHFVQTLSANAYRHDLAVADEQAPMMPSRRATYYLASKMAQELYVTFRAHEEGITVSHLRLSSVYGKGAAGPVTSMARRLLRGEPITLVNKGAFGADFVTVSDVANALILALQKTPAGPLNIGSGAKRTIADIAAILLLETGASASLVDHETSEVDDIGFPALDIGRARALGFDPVQLEQGIASMVAAMREDGV